MRKARPGEPGRGLWSGNRALRGAGDAEHWWRDRRAGAAVYPAAAPQPGLTSRDVQPGPPLGRRQVDHHPLPAASAAGDAITSPVSRQHAALRHPPRAAVRAGEHRPGTRAQHQQVRGQLARHEYWPVVRPHPRSPPPSKSSPAFSASHVAPIGQTRETGSARAADQRRCAAVTTRGPRESSTQALSATATSALVQLSKSLAIGPAEGLATVAPTAIRLSCLMLAPSGGRQLNVRSPPRHVSIPSRQDLLMGVGSTA